ncbi:hypothetical protein WN943_023761 [Citrus x changshan-huyou]
MQMKLEEKLNLDIIPNFANGPKADIRKGFRKLFSAKGDCTLNEMDTKCDLIQYLEEVNLVLIKALYSGTLLQNSFTKKLLKKLEILRDEAKICFQGKISLAMRTELSSYVTALPLDQAKRMVDKLQSLHCYKDKKWEIVSKVRVELISYAACHSRSTRTHVEQVSNGGELFTFVWVLMAHFGLAEPKSED